MDDRNEADQLNRLWDELLDVVEDPSDPSGWLPSLEAMTAMARRDQPEPARTFATTLRRRLLASEPPPTANAASRARTPLGVVHPALVPPTFMLRRVAIAALIAILIAGAFAGTRWLPPSDNSPIVASALASSIPGTAAPDATPSLHFMATVVLDSPTIVPQSLLKHEGTPGRSSDSSHAKEQAARGD